MLSRTLLLVGLVGCAHSVASFDDEIETPDSGKAKIDTGAPPPDDEGADVAAPPPTCPYPSGPYGIDPGTIVSPTMTWQGYRPGQTTVGTISMQDLFDCDGSKGVNAIVVDTSAVWCGPCNQESAQLETVMQSQWGPAGVEVIVLLWQSLTKGPATIADVTAWKNKYSLDMVSVGLDTKFLFAHPNSTVSLPTNVLINPRTMKIEAIGKGYGGGPDPVVMQLASANKI